MKKTKHVAAHHHEDLSKHARALVTATEHIAEDKVAEARARLSALIEDAKEKWEYVEEKAAETARHADEFVHEKPYHVIAAGVGLGVLIGYLIGRK
jgi:ElaB/YqjD/DUF883 family membrane-anchored ribosome-binding protein